MSNIVAVQPQLFRAVAARARDYWLLSKPRVTLLVWGTNLFGMALAGWAPLGASLSNLIGAWLVIASANALNQVFEAEPDGAMARTRLRPIPGGRIKAGEALAVGLVWGLAGVTLLALLVNGLTAILGAASIVLYALVYTPLKRRTHLCTAIGALPGAIPPLAGWAAVTGNIDPPALLLFAIQFFWQFPHFWSIAWILRDDYAKAGFKMLPYPGADGLATATCCLQYTLAVLPLSLVYAATLSKAWLYVPLALLAWLWLFSASLRFKRESDTDSARKLLKATVGYLPLLLAAMTICL